MSEQSAKAAQAAQDAIHSACGRPFGEHKASVSPTTKGGSRFSMTCPPGHAAPSHTDPAPKEATDG